MATIRLVATRVFTISLWLGLSVGYAAAAPEAQTVIQGEKIPASSIGESYVESMAEARERLRKAPPKATNPKEAERQRYGEWKVPSRGSTGKTASGDYYVINNWGDLRMGIGFPEVVDVHGVWVVGQMDQAVWPAAIRAIGYRAGLEVERTNWFTDFAADPTWFAMDLCDIDRLVIVGEPSRAVPDAGWYGIDDLTYTPLSEDAPGLIVVDFDDLSYKATLSTTRYAGLEWEFGTGSDLAGAVHPPRVPPGAEEDADGPGVVAGGGFSGTGGALPELVDDFQGIVRGDAGQWSYPPDTHGAVGPDQFVSVVNRVFAVYDKQTGALLENMSLGSFLPGSSGDPRVLYDQHDDRWVVIITNFSNRIYLAYSLTDDAMGSWFKTNFVVSEGSDADKWPDYPTLGVDKRGIYTASYMVGGNNRMSLFAIDKAPLLASPPELVTVTAFRDLWWEGAIQPVHTYGDPGVEYVVSRSGSSSIRLRSINPPLYNPTLSELGFFTVPSGPSPPDAPVMGAAVPLDTVGSRLMNAVYRDGSIWAAHTIGVNNVAACRWYELDPDSVALIQSGTVGAPDINYFFPSITVNKFGHVAMGFSGSNADQFAGTYYTGRRASDPPGEMAPPVQYKAGNASQSLIDQYGRNRFGDYSYTTLDPVDEELIYTVQEYTESDNVWGTWVAALRPGDCNGNGVDDGCDLDCGPPGGACDVAGCGQSTDCDGNGRLDECESIIGACCLPDGSCCNRISFLQCSQIGSWLGDGVDCAEVVGSECLPTPTDITLSVGSTSVFPNGGTKAEVFVDEVESLFSYGAAINIELVSGSGDAFLSCPSGATVDTGHPDYVFEGRSAISLPNCASESIEATLTGGAPEDVGVHPNYLGEFVISIAEETTPGTVFEVSLRSEPGFTYLRAPGGANIPYQPGAAITLTVLDPSDCFPPSVAAEGCRSLSITPSGAATQALLVRGEQTDGDVSCVDAYVQADGTLGPNPVFQSAAAWGTVHLRSDQIIPEAPYQVLADCGAPGNPLLAPPEAATTWLWGDVESPPNGVVNLADVLEVIRAIEGEIPGFVIARGDVEPCEPNGLLNLADALTVLLAVEGNGYTELGCPVPCE